MKKLIRAEFYRLIHSSHCLIYVIGLSLLGVLFPFMQNGFIINRQVFASGIPTGIMFALISVGISIGRHYKSRTACYEIMDGASAHSIIISRIVVYTSLIFVFYYIPLSVLLMIFDNGDNLYFILLVLIIILRLLFFTVFVSLIFKTAEGAALPFARFLIEMLPAMLYSTGELDLSDAESFLEWYPLFQCLSLGIKTVENTFILKIIIGFVIESAVMYVFAYISYSRKWNVRSAFT